MASVFLEAEWRKLAMANYLVDAAVLKPYLPAGTEIDLWEGKCFVSLIGFMFLNTKVKGFRIPCHTDFEEVNLRFYVRYFDNGLWKRGVVFIKEIVPKVMLAQVANRVYNEKYVALPMKHTWNVRHAALTVAYKWKTEKWNALEVKADPQAIPIRQGSEEEFITEHYWGYTKLSESKTAEYEVVHPQWHVYSVKQYSIDVDFREVYGQPFSFLNNCEPHSVFLAEGSEIKVLSGKKI